MTDDIAVVPIVAATAYSALGQSCEVGLFDPSLSCDLHGDDVERRIMGTTNVWLCDEHAHIITDAHDESGGDGDAE